MSQESRGLGQTDIVTVFATRQALTRSSQNSEVGTVLANFIYGEQKNGEAPSLASYSRDNSWPDMASAFILPQCSSRVVNTY